MQRRALVFCLVTCFALVSLGASAAKDKPKRLKKKEIAAAIAELPAKYQIWLDLVAILVSDEERLVFLELKEDYQRDAFIERFWRVRDTYPDTARNEFRDRWEARHAEVLGRYGELDERARMWLLNGPPAVEMEVKCGTLLWPTEIWVYHGTERSLENFLLIFVKHWGAGPYKLWDPSDGLDYLFQEPGTQGANDSQLLSMLANGCYRGDEIAGAINLVLQTRGLQHMDLRYRITRPPEGPGGEWVTTFESYSTDLPEGADLLEGTLAMSFPGRRQSRTIVQGVVDLELASAEAAELGEARSYNFLITGEVLSGPELHDTFRYKYDFPAAELLGVSAPLVYQRYLRPGTYRIVTKVEDVNGGRFLRFEEEVEVPRVERAPPPPMDSETAQVLAEANALLSTGEVTLNIIEPLVSGTLMTGMQRFDTQVTGQGIERVIFSLDGRPVLTKRRPPYSVELDLGLLPRPRELRVAAYDGEGLELASDEMLVNASNHRFEVRLIDPTSGGQYVSSLRARAQVETPDGVPVERVEFFLNETRVATLYQEPWVQPIVLPEAAQVGYVQAVAYLPDGNSTQDLAFINTPDVVDEVNIEFVELYTTVLDRQGRPVQGLEADRFVVQEDGVEQEVRRFERVSDLPIHATFLMDVSKSMEDRLEASQRAALTFFEGTLTPRDRASVITFNDHPNLAVKFTNDTSLLAGGLAGLKAERGTSLYDALIFSLYYFNGISGQRALLVLSDGKDESSRFAYEEALEYAQRAGVTIYSIGLDIPRSGRRELTRFAEETGGRSFFIAGPSELGEVYRQIEQELRSQYLLAYQSSNTSGSRGFRSVEVKVSEGGMKAKTMRGYYP